MKYGCNPLTRFEIEMILSDPIVRFTNSTQKEKK